MILARRPGQSLLHAVHTADAGLESRSWKIAIDGAAVDMSVSVRKIRVSLASGSPYEDHRDETRCTATERRSHLMPAPGVWPPDHHMRFDSGVPR